MPAWRCRSASGALVNAGLLLVGLLRRGVYRPRPGWGGFAVRVAAGHVALGAGLAWAAHGIDWIGLQAHWGQRAGAVALVLAGVALLYLRRAGALRPAAAASDPPPA